jgi:hypothetical protein
VLLIFLFMGLFCFRDYSHSRDEENANLIYTQRLIPATYYDRDANPAKTHGPGYNQRARPTSYAAPYASSSDSITELQYPATAYPFTGYSVVSHHCGVCELIDEYRRAATATFTQVIDAGAWHGQDEGCDNMRLPTEAGPWKDR